MREERNNKSQARLLFINNLIRRRRTEAGAGILALVLLHFVSQIIFFPEENFLSRKTVFETDVEQKIEVAAETKAVQPDIEIKNKAEAPDPESVQPIALSKSKAEAPTERKIADRESKRTREESRSARLRRAEMLLTGH